VDLVLLTAKNLISDAAFFAGDSDFLPAIDAAKPEGVVIHLFHGQHPHNDLVTRCDERTRIDQVFIDSILGHEYTVKTLRGSGIQRRSESVAAGC